MMFASGDMTAQEGEVPPFWQDREVRFDVTAGEYALRRGEFIIDTLDGVEDTKGNNGERGMLCVTNLRLLWHCEREPKVNLSVGFGSVLNITINNANSRLRGQTQSLYVSSKFSKHRYEFTFTYLVNESPRLFTTVTAVWKAYETSRVYRDLKLRCAIISEDELILLPGEQIFTKTSGVWNLSSDTGTLGTLYITNVRVVWFANLAENFNVSIPHIQIIAIKCRDTKFGPAFVVETSSYASNYVLGFRIDPPDRVLELYKELHSMWKLYSTAPVLGVAFELEQAPSTLDQTAIQRVVDGLDLVTDVATDAFVAYYADEGQKNSDRKPVYDAALGLAVEKPRGDVSLEALWAIPV
jgi:Bardet-Biedl syndrome 5 protein